MPTSTFRQISAFAFGALALVLPVHACSGQALNGFDVSNATVPLEEIFRGGPPRDGIPSIDEPKFLRAADVIVGGEAKAYPVGKLPDGTAVEDEIGGQRIKFTWDADARRPQVLDAAGNAVPAVMVFWFAWQAFYPDTGLWEP